MLQDFSEQQELNRLQRERRKTLKEIEQEDKMMNRGPVDDPSEKLTTPEFLATWKQMTPQERQEYLAMVYAAQSLKNPMMSSPIQAMFPYMAMMQQKPQNEISVKDLAEMFKAGIEAATRSVPAQPHTDPLKIVETVTNLIKPFQEQANQKTQKRGGRSARAAQEQDEHQGRDKRNQKHNRRIRWRAIQLRRHGDCENKCPEQPEESSVKDTINNL